MANRPQHRQAVDALTSLEAALEDGSPNVEASMSALSFTSGSVDPDLADRAAYHTATVSAKAEVDAMSRMEAAIEEGRSYIALVYSYRGLSPALSLPVRTDIEDDEQDRNHSTWEVLEVEVAKIKSLMYFHATACAIVSHEFSRLAEQEDSAVSAPFLHAFLRLLDVLLLLDSVKASKSSLKTDFGLYKRSYAKLGVKGALQDEENNRVQLFLGTPNASFDAIVKTVKDVSNHQILISRLLTSAADAVDAQEYTLPSEKDSLLRSIPQLLRLLDVAAGANGNGFKIKKIPVTRYLKLISKFPVLPLYGDMHFSVADVLGSAPRFEPKLLPKLAEKNSSHYHLGSAMDTIRANHNQYLADVATLVAEVNASYAAGVPVTKDMALRVYDTVYNGIDFIGDWSNRLRLFWAYKLAHPAPKGSYPPEASAYESRTRYNLSSEEKTDLVELIAVIKGACEVLSSAESAFAPHLLASIHYKVQNFVKNTTRDMIRQAVKGKKALMKEGLYALRDVGADWPVSPAQDPVLNGRKATAPFPVSAVPAGPTRAQLFVLRSLASQLVDEKVAGMGKTGKFASKDVKKDDRKALAQFVLTSQRYPYMMALSQTMTQMSDLGDLWLREYHIEMEKRPQYPIDTSMPWMLAQHVLDLGAGHPVLESVLFPMDIYNDAASRALNTIGRQYMFEEVQAEVNLCFDQFVFKLSDSVFRHYKTWAGSIVLDKELKVQLGTVDHPSKYSAPLGRYEVLLKQKHMSLLGKSLDLGLLVGQRLNNLFRKNLRIALNRFESGSLLGVLELKNMVRVAQVAHELLGSLVRLDAFRSLWNEVNESTSLLSYQSRVLLHTLSELAYDFLPNYCFNSVTNRWVRTSFSFAKRVQREIPMRANHVYFYGSKALNSAYANVAALTDGFFGPQHHEALLSFLSEAEIALLVGELIPLLEQQLLGDLAPWIDSLASGLPEGTKMSPMSFGTGGAFGFYQLNLKAILTYQELKPEVFQRFRFIGNTILFVHQLEVSGSAADVPRFMSSASFLGLTPDPPGATELYQDNGIRPLVGTVEEVVDHMRRVPGAAKARVVLSDLVANAKSADALYRPKAETVSFLKTVMLALRSILDTAPEHWRTGRKTDGKQAEGDVPMQDRYATFTRLWSALQFVFCLPPVGAKGFKQFNNFELFGDGMAWGGIALVYLLGQREMFEAFDSCYHLLEVDEYGDSKEKPEHFVAGFVSAARFIKEVNTQVFGVLEAQVPLPKKEVKFVEPPADDSDSVTGQIRGRPVTMAFAASGGVIPGMAFGNMMGGGGPGGLPAPPLPPGMPK